MTIGNVLVGTSAVALYESVKGFYAEVMIQNLSTNNVYVISRQGDTVANGLLLRQYDTYSNDKETDSIYLVADGAASDVRTKIVVREETKTAIQISYPPANHQPVEKTIPLIPKKMDC